MFNEFCVLAISYHLFIYTDFVDDDIIQYSVGWSLIVLTTLVLLSNSMIVIYVSIKGLGSFIRIRWNRAKMRKRQQKYLNELKDIIGSPNKNNSINLEESFSLYSAKGEDVAEKAKKRMSVKNNLSFQVLKKNLNQQLQEMSFKMNLMDPNDPRRKQDLLKTNDNLNDAL